MKRFIACLVAAVAALSVVCQSAVADFVTGRPIQVSGVDAFDAAGGDQFNNFGPLVNPSVGAGFEFTGINYSQFLGTPHPLDIDIDGINSLITFNWTGPAFTGGGDNPADIIIDFISFAGFDEITSVTPVSSSNVTIDAPIFTSNQIRFNVTFLAANTQQGTSNSASAVYSYTAIPEPATGVVSLLALAGLGLMRRKRR